MRTAHVRAVAAALVAWTSACARGAGCGANPSCDETRDPAPGCRCDDTEPEPCYFGPAGTLGRGACAAGVMTCDGGAWGPCEGEVLPTGETCDGVDDDCDGEIDDDCDAGLELALGDEEHPWDPEGEGSGALVLDGGSLTLDEGGLRHPFVWIPHSLHGRVSRVHTRTREQEGRYLVGPGAPWSVVRGIGVSLEGNVVVSVLDGSGVARVTRVDARDCPPGDTSAGGDDVLGWGEDACVVWSTELPIGGDFALQLGAVAWEVRSGLDGVERWVWVADPFGRRVLEIDEDGNPTGREVDVSPTQAGALALAPGGHLWVAPVTSAMLEAQRLVEVETEDAEVVGSHAMPGKRFRCLAVDPEGRVWVSSVGWASVYDPDAGEFTTTGIVNAVGIAVDGTDRAWFAGYDGIRERVLVYRLDRDTLEFERLDVGLTPESSEEPQSMPYTAVDADAQVWAMEATFGTAAHALSPDDPAAWEVAVDGLESPGACGDMTGAGLANVVEPAGTYRHVFEGCEEAGATRWVSIRYEAEAPGSARIHFAVRTAETLAGLASAEWVPAGTASADPSPLDVAGAFEAAGVAPASLLEVRMTLLAGDGGERPLLHEIAVRRICTEGPI